MIPAIVVFVYLAIVIYIGVFAFRGRPDNGDPNYSKGGLIEGVKVGYDARGSKATSNP